MNRCSEFGSFMEIEMPEEIKGTHLPLYNILSRIKFCSTNLKILPYGIARVGWMGG